MARALGHSIVIVEPVGFLKPPFGLLISSFLLKTTNGVEAYLHKGKIGEKEVLQTGDSPRWGNQRPNDRGISASPSDLIYEQEVRIDTRLFGSPRDGLESESHSLSQRLTGEIATMPTRST